MLLQDIKLPAGKISALNRNDIYTVEEFECSAPRKYLYFDKVYGLDVRDSELMGKIGEKAPVAVIGTMSSVVSDFNKNTKRSIIKCRINERQSGRLLFVNILGEYKKLAYYQSLEQKDVIVGGVLQYSDQFQSFSMLNPVVLSANIQKYNRIIPVYRKYKGISEEYYNDTLKSLLQTYPLEEYVDAGILRRYKLPSIKSAIYDMHYPLLRENIEKSHKRLVFDRMFYFAVSLAVQNSLGTSTDIYAPDREMMDRYIRSLPYTPTSGQRDAMELIARKVAAGERLTALVQGDVGCGKTMIAFASMFLLAGNGYQSVLLAPTVLLARQHFTELEKYGLALGIRTAYLGSDLTAKEKRETLKGIKNGFYKFVVGTHSCFSKDVEYDNLGLAVTDEEHKFGVAQRARMAEKEKGTGIHVLTMSATPIPRTIAAALYGDSVEVITVKDRPEGRKPIQTAVCTTFKTIFKFLEKELAKGHQVYVVCPLINEAAEGGIMEGVHSVEEVAKMYSDYFEPLGYKIGTITGKDSREKQEEAKERFYRNETSILVATTVVEVGINVPNATCIVVTSAERFGLATLHQLRGRVGRSALQSYCVLQKSSPETDASRLEILCRETDGFEIAKADLESRGAGNLIGLEQSGNNRYITLMLQYPNLYNATKKIAAEYCEADPEGAIAFVEKYKEAFPS